MNDIRFNTDSCFYHEAGFGSPDTQFKQNTGIIHDKISEASFLMHFTTLIDTQEEIMTSNPVSLCEHAERSLRNVISELDWAKQTAAWQQILA